MMKKTLTLIALLLATHSGFRQQWPRKHTE
jgi:hypothetical protein